VISRARGVSLPELWHCLKAMVRFRDYRPQSVTRKIFANWIEQFDPRDRKDVLKALNRVNYLSEDRTRRTLVHLNEALLKRLQDDGVSPDKVIYVQYDDPGSSSPVMLNLLRDASQLERRGCKLVDANNHLEVYKATNSIEGGAIVYVDDFIGSANQFQQTRTAISRQIVGTFTEFLLVAAICEEGVVAVTKMGIEAVTSIIDVKADRPLHPFSSHLSPEARGRLEAICLQIDANLGLGVHQLSSMTVLYRNAPDTFPLLFRGSINQSPVSGILPRAQDLPIRKLG